MPEMLQPANTATLGTGVQGSVPASLHIPSANPTPPARCWSPQHYPGRWVFGYLAEELMQRAAAEGMALPHVGVGHCPAHPSPPAFPLALRPSCPSLYLLWCLLCFSSAPGFLFASLHIKAEYFRDFASARVFYGVRNPCPGSAPWEAAAAEHCGAVGLRGPPEQPWGGGSTHGPFLRAGAFVAHFRQSKGERGRVNMAC